MKKFVLLFGILLFGLVYVLNDPWLKNKLDSVLPTIDSYYQFREEEQKALEETLECFELDSLSNNSFFSMRYVFFWEDGCLYRSVVDFICNTENLADCYRVIYKYKGDELLKKKKIVPKKNAEYYFQEIQNIKPFDLKSVKSEPFFVHFGFMYTSDPVSMNIYEIADRNRNNRFSIATSGSKKSYNKLIEITKKIVEEK